MRCATSVLGFYAPAVRFGSCHIVASSLRVWSCQLKYDWTLIQRVVCHPVAGLPDYRCFAMAPQFPSLGIFHPSSMRCFQTQVQSFVMDDLLVPVFASFALVKVVPVNLCPLLLFDMCDYLVITGGLISRCRVFVTHLLRLDVLRLSHFCHSSLLSVTVCACVLPVWERTALQHLPFDD